MSFFKSLNPKIDNWRGKNVWIIGASSGIGLETAKLLAARGAYVCLSARRAEPLLAAAAESRLMCAEPLDITDLDSIQQVAKRLVQRWGALDLILIAAGSYVEMRATSFDVTAAESLFKVNVLGVFKAVSVVLPHLLEQKSGGIGIISSVAGYRGLPRALIYGPSKAALNNFAESLYMDCRAAHVSVYLICPGFVKTQLTAENSFYMPALITPEQAAGYLVEGLEKGDFEIHFPKRFTRCLKFLKLFSYRWYFSLVALITGV